MKVIHVLALVATAAWAFVLLGSLGGKSMSLEQAQHYRYVPACFLGLVAVAWLLASRRLLKLPALVVIVLALLALPAYLFFYTGGM